MQKTFIIISIENNNSGLTTVTPSSALAEELMCVCECVRAFVRACVRVCMYKLNYIDKETTKMIIRNRQ